MAFKNTKGVYLDRPLLTEDELKFIMLCVQNTTVMTDDLKVKKDACMSKLLRSKLRIDKLK